MIVMTPKGHRIIDTGDTRGYKTVTDLYLASLHFSVMTLTTVGYGDVMPLTNIEYLTTTIYM